MALTIQILPKVLHFKQPARTSRGAYTVRKVWYIVLSEGTAAYGYGECAPLPDLSCDAFPHYEQILCDFAEEFSRNNQIEWEKLRAYPSMLLGFETAYQQLQQNSFQLWDTPFSRGEEGIPINGLIWMDSYEQMKKQIEHKLERGFRLIKLKIGAIDFEEEIDLLQSIRRDYTEKEIQLRVDANGAFSPLEAMSKLKRLAKLDIHSIEQPIKAGQWEEMAALMKSSPLPIALDEELIGVNDLAEKQRLLEVIAPHFLVLKPSLHGGFSGCEEWIEEAERRNIGWWITSALESNLGLNAIAQWTATLNSPLPQGLGTGALFKDNVSLPLEIRQSELRFDPKGVKDFCLA